MSDGRGRVPRQRNAKGSVPTGKHELELVKVWGRSEVVLLGLASLSNHSHIHDPTADDRAQLQLSVSVISTC